VAILIDQFSADGILKNPPVVAELKDKGYYILLDGANRVTALRNMDYRDVLVQIIDYQDPGLILSRWHHAVEKLDKGYFSRELAKIPEVTIRKADPEGEDFLCQFIFKDKETFVLQGGSGLRAKVSLLKRITALYKGSEFMDRVSYTNFEHLQKNYPNFTALVSFPQFTKEEIKEITEKGLRLPSGLTRILVPKRALRLNVHLDLLKAKLSLEEKNHWLERTITQMILNKTIRFYQEPTFLFDE